MYRYVDSLWRWYNGTARGYSGFMTQASNSYPYKDEEIVSYTFEKNDEEWFTSCKITTIHQKYRHTRKINYNYTR